MFDLQAERGQTSREALQSVILKDGTVTFSNLLFKWSLTQWAQIVLTLKMSTSVCSFTHNAFPHLCSGSEQTYRNYTGIMCNETHMSGTVTGCMFVLHINSKIIWKLKFLQISHFTSIPNYVLASRLLLWNRKKKSLFCIMLFILLSIVSTSVQQIIVFDHTPTS